ncbi:MAG TPA: hypothetical protein VI997_07280 [Candidatus Thermoplasmatota archaeon]|nr:hypothetical protein [Candidatus Thermoplasmatota archaeon]
MKFAPWVLAALAFAGCAAPGVDDDGPRAALPVEDALLLETCVQLSGPIQVARRDVEPYLPGGYEYSPGLFLVDDPTGSTAAMFLIVLECAPLGPEAGTLALALVGVRPTEGTKDAEPCGASVVRTFTSSPRIAAMLTAWGLPRVTLAETIGIEVASSVPRVRAASARIEGPELSVRFDATIPETAQSAPAESSIDCGVEDGRILARMRYELPNGHPVGHGPGRGALTTSGDAGIPASSRPAPAFQFEAEGNDFAFRWMVPTVARE